MDFMGLSKPAQYDVKVASREEVKQSMGLSLNTEAKPRNVFKHRKEPKTEQNNTNHSTSLLKEE